MSTVQWDIEVDVVVIGSGGTGLVAAIVAADRGAKVAVYEKAALLGGTTAISGGQVWVANNPLQAAEGILDSREEAVTYLRHVTSGAVPDELIQTYLDKAVELVDYLHQRTPVRFHICPHRPDYRDELPGAKLGGRVLDPDPFPARQELGDWADLVPASPHFSALTHTEAEGWNAFAIPANIDFNLVAHRITEDIRTLGSALVAGLVKGCLDRSIPLVTGTAAKRLIKEEGRIVGVEFEQEDKPLRVRATRGVILATGGFEWDESLSRQFLKGPIAGPASPPYSTGDGLRMAIDVGADLGTMNEAWWCPTFAIPGEEYEGRPLYRMARGERCLPHSIIVNRYGRRFMDEAHNYNDISRAFHHFDPVRYEYPNLPAWIILDSQFRTKYQITTTMPDDPDPEWLIKADTLEELAEKVGIDPGGLKETVARFNGFAREGVDSDFGRGGNPNSRYYGDPRHGPNPVLGTLEQGPYYAIEVLPGVLGTKGGARTDASARVLDVWGKPIRGLYAAGNCAASMTGPGYFGAGGTLGPALTFGFVAGQSVTE